MLMASTIIIIITTKYLTKDITKRKHELNVLKNRENNSQHENS